ncbi:MAG TPA: tetratricopeptide repeat protein [Burkholderiaceae bacterium]|nr:tetratricopeptide repeat protein [Burkholderiaceae bacterium]
MRLIRFVSSSFLPSLLRWLPCLLLSALAVGCATTDPRAGLESDMRACAAAERSGDLETALVACQRARANTREAALGPAAESVTLYNLGRVQKKAQSFGAAEAALRRSLAIEESLSGPASLDTGRRLAELSAVLLLQGRTAEGEPLLERLLAIAPQYQGGDRSYVANVLFRYAEELRKNGRVDLAARLDKTARALGFHREQFLAR